KTNSPDGAYDTRGVVTGVEPRTATTPARLSIHHVAIPEFVNRGGERVGMDSMVMHFDVAGALDVKTLAVGDKLAFRFEVRWDAPPMLLVTGLEKLPGAAALGINPDHHSAHGAHQRPVPPPRGRAEVSSASAGVSGDFQRRGGARREQGPLCHRRLGFAA